jgi:hypothetical protein
MSSYIGTIGFVFSGEPNRGEVNKCAGAASQYSALDHSVTAHGSACKKNNQMRALEIENAWAAIPVEKQSYNGKFLKDFSRNSLAAAGREKLLTFLKI